MNDLTSKSADDERYRPSALIKRLVTEQGLVHWRRYLVAFVLMALSAACTAMSAYLIGHVIDQTYVNHNLNGVVMLGGITAALFAVKGIATYGHTVMLSRIGNRIVANNQRAVFSKLLNEGVSFFSDRHSTEFIARLTTGAAACTQVINILITSFGRDLLSLIGLLTVMVVQDPLMSFFSFVVAPPAFLILRKMIRRVYGIARSQFHGGYRVIDTGATPGQFFSFIAAFLLAYEPAKRLARLNIELNSNLVGVRILFEVIDSPPSEPSDINMPALRAGPARLELDDVSFHYRSDESVLNGMSITAEPGKLTALVGPSGGGKSTIFSLIMRFYDTERGKIVIDGQDISQVSRRSLRQHIAYVGQDVFLFRDTIRENIAFGKPGASEDEIVAAAKAAYAHDFIMTFPRGYDTPVGEHGLQLSGGQRQRVAIARALIKNAPIILLDEATAALDSESELQVREAMERLCQGRTTLAIAHRLHTVSHADRIYVLEDGRATESGRHDELLRKNGRYAAFYRLQLKQQETRAPVEAAAQ